MEIEKTIHPPTELVEKCCLCGGTTFEPELKSGKWQLCRCLSCGLVFTSPRYQTRYLQQLYEERYYETVDSYLKTQLIPPSSDELAFAEKLRGNLSLRDDRQLHSLDIGCGAGRVVSAFRQAGWDAWGCDPSLKAVELGKSKGLRLCAGDIRAVAQTDFDLMTAFHVLEHTVDPKTFLIECHSKLRPGGLILLEVPDYGSRRARKMKESWPFLYPDTHFYQFTASTLRRLLAESGFRIDRIAHTGGRGPLETSATTAEARKPYAGADWRTRIFELRQLIYWIPGIRSAIRYSIWQLLGYGEYLRILARRDRD